MKKENREFQVFAKPVGASCNLRCSYCYYLEKESLYKEGFRIITDATLEEYIRQHIEATTGDVVQFSWHGGEPLLAGPDFFRKVVSIQVKYLPEGMKVQNGIQTNGTLINEEWCNFFKTNGFVIGISIDGPEDLHNYLRKDSKGSTTFDIVLKAYSLLLKHNIQNEILCVVNPMNVLYPLQTYGFFRSIGASYITFIPLVEEELKVDPEEYGAFLITIFNEWKHNDIGRIKVQIFEEALRSAFGQDHTLCIFKPKCGGVPVIERNGDFYSCDHFVDKDHLIGNIHENHLSEMLDSKEQHDFGLNKMQSLPDYCRKCEVLDMCNGGCPKNRITNTPDGSQGLNYLCPAYQLFFNYVRPFVRIISEAWRIG